VKRAAIYGRVSTVDQHPESQLLDLRQLAQQRNLQITKEYIDHGVSGVRVRRPALDQLMVDAHRGQFDVVLIWSFDRLARSVRHLLDTLDELGHLGVEFISMRESIDTAGPLGRALLIIIAAISELERSLIIERVRCGMRRAKLEGRRIGRRPFEVDRAAIVRDRERGLSLGQLAKCYQISRTSVRRVLQSPPVPKGALQPPL
jgi:DNA invertase Pin-like site-specific DNA recombinase